MAIYIKYIRVISIRLNWLINIIQDILVLINLMFHFSKQKNAILAKYIGAKI